MKIVMILLLISVALFAEEDKFELNGADGPYIFHKNNDYEVIYVNSQNEITRTISAKRDFICKVENADKDSFRFTLQDEIKIPKSKYKMPEKIVALSDIEGNFNAFYSLLKQSKVIDENFNWIFGDGHLVLNGDMVDRGENVTQCLWLIYKLESEAEQAGGKVHFIMGNHEVMTFKARTRYIADKYIALAQQISGETDPKIAYNQLFSTKAELIRWLKTKNCIEQIGDIIFVHAGLSSELQDSNLSFDKINQIFREQISEMLTLDYDYNDKEKMIFGRMGPLWYRGLAKDYKDYYKKIEPEELNEILAYHEANNIVVGHTILDSIITTNFAGKVIYIDVHHGKEKLSDKSEALIIEDSNFFRMNGLGEKYKLIEH